jgi:xylulose-5-phosphate/fructose-6-phosphate phosphoketolase
VGRPGPLQRDELESIDAWWRAANYLAVGQIYLMSNPLLRERLESGHIKPRLLGHFGTVPGLNHRPGDRGAVRAHVLLEGYLLTGRHGVFTCYQAFIHIIDAMFNQHAEWLDASAAVPWRRPIASLNYLLLSHVWRQDHNGFTHQDPGFLDVVLNKKASIVRVYLPPDANTLLSTYDHCLRSRHCVNVVVAGKQPQADWLSVPDAAVHCARGAGIWDWAGQNDDPGTTPDVILACAGDIPTLEKLAAAAILRARLPELRIRVVNVVDLMRLQPSDEHPHGLSDSEFDTLW